MPSAEEQALENRKAALDNKEKELRILEAQVKKEAATHHEQTKEKLKKEYAALEKLKTELEPREAACKAEEGRLAALAHDLEEKAKAQDARQTIIKANSDEVTRLEEDLKTREKQLDTAKKAHNAEVTAWKAKQKAEEAQWEAQKSHQQDEINQAKDTVSQREIKATEREKALEINEAAAKSLIDENAALKVKLETDVANAEASVAARETTLAEKSEAVNKINDGLTEREAAATQKEQDNKAEAERLATLAAGLEKAKSDLELAKLKVQKLQKDVDAKIEKNNLKKELEPEAPAGGGQG